jgi:hypothetical protein
MPVDNGPCSVCEQESDHQCFRCGAEVCRDHTRTCVQCTNAFCAHDVRTIFVNAVSEDVCAACEKGHRCEQWLEHVGGHYESIGTGESFWGGEYRCVLCGANLSVRDLEAA